MIIPQKMKQEIVELFKGFPYEEKSYHTMLGYMLLDEGLEGYGVMMQKDVEKQLLDNLTYYADNPISAFKIVRAVEEGTINELTAVVEQKIKCKKAFLRNLAILTQMYKDLPDLNQEKADKYYEEVVNIDFNDIVDFWVDSNLESENYTFSEKWELYFSPINILHHIRKNKFPELVIKASGNIQDYQHKINKRMSEHKRN